jgi:hypothetical protein
MDLFKEALTHLETHIGVILTLAVIALIATQLARFLTWMFAQCVVRGKWETHLRRLNGFARHEDASLRQCIHFVWGTTTTQTGRMYRVRGRIRGDRMRLIYESTNGGTDGGAVLLRVSANGEAMRGYEIGTSGTSNQIYSRQYKWEKKP